TQIKGSSSLHYRQHQEPDLARRSSDVLILAARFEVETERRIITVTMVQGSDASEEDQPVPTQNGNSDDEQDGKEDGAQPTEVRSSTVNAPTSIDRFPSDIDIPSTTTTKPPINNSQDEQGNHGTGLSAGAAAGITAAAVASAALITAATFFLWRRRQGGIRGAVITADYPRGLEDVQGQGPNLPVVPPPAESGGGIGGQIGYDAAEGRYYPPPWLEEHDLGKGRESSAVTGSGGSRREIGQSGFRIPPAGTMPGDPGFDIPGEYPPQQSQQYQGHQQSRSGGDLGEARP
ncbi:hypothetical protein L209DRAFT_659194, partial [Thermothelomyces heterothallicus CBS 203.75]